MPYISVQVINTVTNYLLRQIILVNGRWLHFVCFFLGYFKQNYMYKIHKTFIFVCYTEYESIRNRTVILPRDKVSLVIIKHNTSIMISSEVDFRVDVVDKITSFCYLWNNMASEG